jgi:hypothetical protein
VIISGTGPGSQTFALSAIVGTDGNPLRFPINSAKFGLLSMWPYTQLPQQDVRTGAITFISLPLPTALPSRCSAASTPTTLGQRLDVQDGSGFTLETHLVELVNVTPGGPQQPMWRSSAFAGGKYTSPFTIMASNMAPSVAWSFSFPGRIDWNL